MSTIKQIRGEKIATIFLAATQIALLMMALASLGFWLTTEGKESNLIFWLLIASVCVSVAVLYVKRKAISWAWKTYNMVPHVCKPADNNDLYHTVIVFAKMQGDVLLPMPEGERHLYGYTFEEYPKFISLWGDDVPAVRLTIQKRYASWYASFLGEEYKYT